MKRQATLRNTKVLSTVLSLSLVSHAKRVRVRKIAGAAARNRSVQIDDLRCHVRKRQIAHDALLAEVQARQALHVVRRPRKLHRERTLAIISRFKSNQTIAELLYCYGY